MLPNWMDVDFLRGAMSGSVVGLAAAALIVLIVVRGLVSKLVTLALIAALALGAITYRTSLEHCLTTCSCRIGSTDIPIHGHGCAGKR